MTEMEKMPIFDKKIESSYLDDKWYLKFEKIGSFQSYEYLNDYKNNQDEQKEKFLNNEIENPRLDYPFLDKEKLNITENNLLDLKKEILSEEKNETVKQLYRWKINEKIAEIRMLKNVLAGKEKRFLRYSKFIYGNPSREIFYYTVNCLNETIKDAENSPDSNLKKAAEELKKSFPGEKNLETVFSLPNSGDFQTVKKETEKEFKAIFNLNTERSDQKLDAEKIKKLFEKAIENLKIKGWNVCIDDISGKSGISVSQEKLAVEIPKTRSVTSEKLRKLILHEVGTHALRRVNGQRSKLMLLGLGLDRYEKGEEGVATMREQIIEENINDFSGLEGHLAISLAIGVDGKPRNFREVYNIMEKYFYFKKIKAGKDIDMATEEACDAAWKRCIRTFRGTNGSASGVCLTKDIIYREGNMEIWRIVGKSPNEIMRFSVGKYDPANERHLWALDQLGITDQDLDELKIAD